MTWRNRYWDIVSNFYWNPSYLGLQSLQITRLEKSGRSLRVPLSALNTSRPIYTRTTKFADTAAKLARKEEVLGHLFNIMFSIAPDALIRRLFIEALGLSDAGPFATLGQQDVVEDFDLAGKNIGQHDGLFLSDQAAIAIELKAGSNSSVNQLLKYLALFGRLAARRPDLREFGLLFVCSESDAPKLLASCGLADGVLPHNFIQTHIDTVNPDVRAELLACRSQIDALSRGLRIAVLTWTKVHDELCDIRGRLDQKDACQQTLHRLLDGFIQQLEVQEKAGVPIAQIERHRPLFVNEKDITAWVQKLTDGAFLDDADRRKALIAYVLSTGWGTLGVIQQCRICTIEELESFVAALKDGVSPISQTFRWASDEYPGAFSI